MGILSDGVGALSADKFLVVTICIYFILFYFYPLKLPFGCSCLQRCQC